MDAAPSTGAATTMEPRRMVGLAFVVFTVIGAMLLSRLAAAALGGLGWNNPSLLGITDLTASSVVGYVLAAACGVALYLNARVHGGSMDIAVELKRVTWPSMGETRVSTIAVIVASVVASLILFFFDYIASKLMTQGVPGLLGWLAGL